MSDDISDKVQQIKDMLNNGKLDELKSMMGMLSPALLNGSPENNQSTEPPGSNSFNPEVMISKITNIMNKRRNMTDPRVNLLASMKPYLNNKRQQKVDSATQILNYVLLAQLLKDDDL